MLSFHGATRAGVIYEKIHVIFEVQSYPKYNREKFGPFLSCVF
jgi:hypothetical protein